MSGLAIGLLICAGLEAFNAFALIKHIGTQKNYTPTNVAWTVAITAVMVWVMVFAALKLG